VIGKTLGEIDVKSTLNVNNKSYPGNVIEQIWFDYPADNYAEPDFPEAPLINKQKQLKRNKSQQLSLERLVLNKINHQNEFGKSFEQESNL
jgi:DNA mismatch repair enzyme MutH